MNITSISTSRTAVILLIIIGTCLTNLLTAQAEETSTSTEMSAVRDRIEDRRETILENQAERAETVESRQASSSLRQAARTEERAERQAALASFRQERVINLAANISNRMDAAVERLFDLVARLETRLQKLEQTGIDTSAAGSKLREASSTLAEAKTALSDIDALVYAATTSEQPRTKWQAVRERYTTVGSLIRTAHGELREAVALIKVAMSGGSTGTRADTEMDTATNTAPTETSVMQPM